MAGPLNSFCIACARFAADDRFGKLLAVVAAAPYFTVYHTAVLLHARRELHMAFVFVGLLLTSGLSSAIKSALNHPRPATTCALLGNCHKAGMPSSHSAAMAYAAAMALLLFRHRRASRQAAAPPGTRGGSGSKSGTGTGAAAPAVGGSSSSGTGGTGGGGGGGSGLAEALARWVELLEIQLLLLLAAAVAYGRVYLGYHSPAQVAAGLALGAAVAALWWQVTLAACARAAPLLRLAPLRGVHLRNTLGCADVHAAEAALFADGGAARPHAN